MPSVYRPFDAVNMGRGNQTGRAYFPAVQCLPGMFKEGHGLKGRGNPGIYRGNNMTRQQAIEYFFNRIRKQILTALANRNMIDQDMV